MVDSPFLILLVRAECEHCLFKRIRGFVFFTSGFGPNPNTNLLMESVSDLTPKPATDSDSRPNPKDSVKSTGLLYCLLEI